MVKRWEDVLKKPIVSFGNLELPDLSNVPESNDCNDELKAYAEKVKGRKMYVKEGLNSADFSHWRSQVEIGEEISNEFFKVIKLRQIEETPYLSPYASYLTEVNSFEYNPVPEEVACKALEMLSGVEIDTGSLDRVNDTVWSNDAGYKISIMHHTQYQWGGLRLRIDKDREEVVKIGIQVGEDLALSPITHNGINMWKAIGFYPARDNMDWR